MEPLPAQNFALLRGQRDLMLRKDDFPGEITRHRVDLCAALDLVGAGTAPGMIRE
jgi:hypothetical protein